MLKTSVAVFIVGGALLFIFRESTIGYPSSVFILSICINYLPLAIWHILIRRGFISEVEVDLAAVDEDEDSDCACCEENLDPDRDGFNVYIRAFFKPNKFIESMKNYGAEFFSSGIILFICSWWMILVYMAFMPDYIRSRFKGVKLAIENFDTITNYLFNYRVFAISVLAIYIIWLLSIYLILRLKSVKEKKKNILAGSMYIYGWNIILYLILIIIGNFSNPYIFIITAAFICLWIFVMNIKLLAGVYDWQFSKSAITTIIGFLPAIIIFAVFIIIVYRPF